MRIAFFDTKPYDQASFDKYNQGKDIEIKYFEPRLTIDTVGLAKGYDAVCVFVNDEVNADIIEKLHKYGVKLVLLRCAGFNNVDTDAIAGKLSVYRVPAYSPYAVAEHAMALLLTSVRRIHKAYNRTRDFNFSLSGLTGFDLHGKTVGVIGTGKIGSIFANICKGFGMEVICYDKFPSADSGLNYVELDELFARADVISLHCPLTPDTKHTIRQENIDKMKKGVIIVNTSRGALINAEDLLKGLKSRKVGAACLDVYEDESNVFYQDISGHILDDDRLARLLSMPNVIVTSHQAFLTEEALNNIAETTLSNAVNFVNGTPNEGNEVKATK